MCGCWLLTSQRALTEQPLSQSESTEKTTRHQRPISVMSNDWWHHTHYNDNVMILMTSSLQCCHGNSFTFNGQTTKNHHSYTVQRKLTNSTSVDVVDVDVAHNAYMETSGHLSSCNFTTAPWWRLMIGWFHSLFTVWSQSKCLNEKPSSSSWQWWFSERPRSLCPACQTRVPVRQRRCDPDYQPRLLREPHQNTSEISSALWSDGLFLSLLEVMRSCARTSELRRHLRGILLIFVSNQH